MRTSASCLLIFLAVPGGALAEELPWYERPACRAVVEASFAADFPSAEAKLKPLESSSDLDDQACAIWARASLGEFQIAVLGKTPTLLAGRKKAISRMGGFGKANAAKGVRFGDLELEARMRRVRVLVEEGNRSGGLSEGKTLQKLLESRPRGTPTLEFVEGTTNGAIASTGWAARAVLSIAGLGSDAKLSAEALNKLADGDSIYKWDAMYMARNFSEETANEAYRKPVEYSKALLAHFPSNPQLQYELARDLWNEKKNADARKAIAPAVAKLDGDPSLWSSLIRTKIYWMAGRTALDAGDRAEAKRRAEQAKAQNGGVLKDEIEDVLDHSGS